MATIWWSDQGTLVFDTADLNTDESARVTDITISAGDRDIEQVKTFGNTSRSGATDAAAANYPNYVMKELRTELVEVSVTFIAQNDWKLAEWVLGGAHGASPSASDYPIYNWGEDARDSITMEYTFKQGSAPTEEHTAFKFNDAYGTHIEWTVSGGETMEVSMTFKLAGHGLWKAYTNNASDYPISW